VKLYADEIRFAKCMLLDVRTVFSICFDHGNSRRSLSQEPTRRHSNDFEVAMACQLSPAISLDFGPLMGYG
jgi:hypothetical protein